MEEIGNLFTLTRETAGVSLKEVSEDLEIEQAILENIEDGRSGAFSDIFVLKEYIYDYARYLGLDAEKILDDFNEYIFEATSKIPIKQIEKQITDNLKNEEDEEERIFSPYTKKTKKVKSGLYMVIYVVLLVAIVLAVFWSVKQITVNNQTANAISYGK